MREVMDSIPSTELEPLFADFFKPLQKGKQLDQFKIFNASYFMPIDATQNFSSKKIKTIMQIIILVMAIDILRAIFLNKIMHSYV